MFSWIKNIFKSNSEIKYTSPSGYSVNPQNGRIVYKIPVGNLSKEQVERVLDKMIRDYWSPLPNPDRIDKLRNIINRIESSKNSI
jgi:hypothetical protein